VLYPKGETNVSPDTGSGGECSSAQQGNTIQLKLFGTIKNNDFIHLSLKEEMLEVSPISVVWNLSVATAKGRIRRYCSRWYSPIRSEIARDNSFISYSLVIYRSWCLKKEHRVGITSYRQQTSPDGFKPYQKINAS
jgi:hypothetical protein